MTHSRLMNRWVLIVTLIIIAFSYGWWVRPDFWFIILSVRRVRLSDFWFWFVLLDDWPDSIWLIHQLFVLVFFVIHLRRYFLNFFSKTFFFLLFLLDFFRFAFNWLSIFWLPHYFFLNRLVKLDHVVVFCFYVKHMDISVLVIWFEGFYLVIWLFQ